MPPRGVAIELLGPGRSRQSFSVGIANGSWGPRFIPLGVAPLSGRDANPRRGSRSVDLDRVDRARGWRRFDRIQVERARSALDDTRLIALSRVFGLRSGRGARFECVEVVGRTAHNSSHSAKHSRDRGQTSVVAAHARTCVHEELPSSFSGTGRSGALFRLELPTGRGHRGSSHWMLLLSRVVTRTPDEDHDRVDLDRIERT